MMDNQQYQHLIDELEPTYGAYMCPCFQTQKLTGLFTLIFDCPQLDGETLRTRVIVLDDCKVIPCKPVTLKS